jgi:hypothetical protein
LPGSKTFDGSSCVMSDSPRIFSGCYIWPAGSFCCGVYEMASSFADTSRLALVAVAGHWLKVFAPEPIDGDTPRRGVPCLCAKQNGPGVRPVIGAFHLCDVGQTGSDDRASTVRSSRSWQRINVKTTIVSYMTARPSRDVVLAAHQAMTRTWWPSAIPV